MEELLIIHLIKMIAMHLIIILLTNNAEYYFSVRPGLNLKSYKPIKRFGIVTIYEKI